jgi:hypothetical protein
MAGGYRFDLPSNSGTETPTDYTTPGKASMIQS